MKIEDALSRLDCNDDAHWTKDGLPLLKVVSKFAGRNITRQEINDVKLGFCRDVARGVVAYDDELKEQAVQESEQQAKSEAELVKRADIESLKDKLIKHIREHAVEIGQLKESIISAQSRIDELNDLISVAEEKLAELKPKVSTTASIQKYIKTQHEIRLKKASAARELLKNVDPKSLNFKSPLDASFARRNTRGTQRPKPRRVA